MNKLFTLTVMQLKDKADLGFVRSRRSLIIKSTLAVVKFVASTAIFFALFYLCVRLSVFSFSTVLPDTVINVLFTVFIVMSIISGTVGLTNSLYFSRDNRVLMTMPVGGGSVFASKLVMFYIFELKRNLFFTLPMFLAYGITNGAVWYFYPWAIIGFAVISAVPVAVGAILSIPALFISAFVRRYKWLQYLLIVAASALVVWALVAVISAIPQNINLLGQWGTISVRIQSFLKAFRDAVKPFYFLCLLVIGGTLRISTAPIGLDTLLYLGVTLAAVAAAFAVAYFAVRPLFFKMVSRQFEYEKIKVPPRKNKVHSPRLAPYFESLKMSFRDGKRVLTAVVELTLPFIAVLLLNKLYAAMNMSFAGRILSQTFSMLVLLVITLSLSSPFASVYSREASARNLLKTRPINMLRMLFSRIAFRALTLVLSAVGAVVAYGIVGGVPVTSVVLLFFATTFLGLAHLLWCAEIDVMKSQAAQYRTVGVGFNDPNERKATAIGTALAVLFTLAFYLFSDTGVTASLVKITIIAAALLAVRVYLYVTRVRLYFAEK